MSSNQRKRERAFDDNGAGVISTRGWQYSADEDGNPIKPAKGDGLMHVKSSSSPPWGSSRPYTPNDEKPNVREELARLTKEERDAWELQNGCSDEQMVRVDGVPKGELVAYHRRGFSVIEGTKRFEKIAGFIVEVWDVEGKEYTQQGMTYEQIAVRMKSSWRQVKRWLLEARRKLSGRKK